MVNNTQNIYDVVIFGGGVAGCASAYIAGKLNLKALLIEKQTLLGGTASLGLVTPCMNTEDKNLNNEFYFDLIDYAKKYDSNITYGDNNSGWFNPIILPLVLENMLKDKNVDILYETEVNDIKSVENANYNFVFNVSHKKQKNNNFIKNDNNILSIPIGSKYIVDGTGSGKISKILGANFLEKNNFQPNSLRFVLSGVNISEFIKFLSEIDDNKEHTNFYVIDNEPHFTTAYTWDKAQNWALEPYFGQALLDNVLHEGDLQYFQVFSVAGMPNSVTFNCPRLNNDDKDFLSYSNSIIEGHSAIFRLYNFCKKYLKGFEDAYISSISPIVGKREEDRVECEYTFSIDDILRQEPFNDAVLWSNYPIDIHSNKKDESKLDKIPTYSFPLRALKVKGIDYLYAIGKCCGADFNTHASLRIQRSCMSMGEAVSRDIAEKLSLNN